MCILSVYTLLKVVGYYDLSVSEGIQKKIRMGGGWVGGVSSIVLFLIFWNFFNFAKPLNIHVKNKTMPPRHYVVNHNTRYQHDSL